MMVLTVIIGIFLLAILIIHIFLTGNSLEKNSMELRNGITAYYKKMEEANEAA